MGPNRSFGSALSPSASPQQGIPIPATRQESPCGGASLVYTGDTGALPSLAPFARGTDLLVCETSLYDEYRGRIPGHMCAAEAGALAREAGAGMLLATHLPHFGEHPVLLRQGVGRFRRKDGIGEPLLEYGTVSRSAYQRPREPEARIGSDRKSRTVWDMDLFWFFLRRFGRLLLTVFIISTLVFFVIRIIPGDPAMIIAGMDAPPEDVHAISGEIGHRQAHHRAISGMAQFHCQAGLRQHDDLGGAGDKTHLGALSPSPSSSLFSGSRSASSSRCP